MWSCDSQILKTTDTQKLTEEVFKLYKEILLWRQSWIDCNFFIEISSKLYKIVKLQAPMLASWIYSSYLNINGQLAVSLWFDGVNNKPMALAVSLTDLYSFNGTNSVKNHPVWLIVATTVKPEMLVLLKFGEIWFKESDERNFDKILVKVLILFCIVHLFCLVALLGKVKDWWFDPNLLNLPKYLVVKVSGLEYHRKLCPTGILGNSDLPDRIYCLPWDKLSVYVF